MKKKTILDKIEEVMFALGGEQTVESDRERSDQSLPGQSPNRGSLRSMVAYGSQGRYKRWDRAGYGRYKPLGVASAPEAQVEPIAAAATA